MSHALMARSYRPRTEEPVDPPPPYPRLDRTRPVDAGRFKPWHEATFAVRRQLRLAADAARDEGRATDVALLEAADCLFVQRYAKDAAFMRGYYRGWALGVDAGRPGHRHVLARIAGGDLDESDVDVLDGLGAGLLEAARRADEYDVQLADDLRRAADHLGHPTGDAS